MPLAADRVRKELRGMFFIVYNTHVRNVLNKHLYTDFRFRFGKAGMSRRNKNHAARR